MGYTFNDSATGNLVSHPCLSFSLWIWIHLCYHVAVFAVPPDELRATTSQNNVWAFVFFVCSATFLQRQAARHPVFFFSNFLQKIFLCNNWFASWLHLQLNVHRSWLGFCLLLTYITLVEPGWWECRCSFSCFPFQISIYVFSLYSLYIFFFIYFIFYIFYIIHFNIVTVFNKI